MTAPMMLSVYIDLVVNFTAGGKSKNKREKPSKHGREKLQQFYSHKFDNQHGAIPMQVITHPAITPSHQA